MAFIDRRRTDERVPVNSESFIFTSGLIIATDKGSDVVLAAFPRGLFVILGPPIVEIIEAFNGTTPLLDIGRGTIPLETTAPSGTLTVVDADEYVKAADLTHGTIGKYLATTSDLVAAFAAGTGEELLIRGAASAVPVITAHLTCADCTTGKARVHMILMKVPVAA